MSPANPGYQAPAVTVASSLPKRTKDSTVLIVPVVSGQDDDATATAVGNPFLDAEAVGEIDVALRAVGAKGGTDQVTRVVAPSLPVASVVAVGLGKDRVGALPSQAGGPPRVQGGEWPTDMIRRAAGVAARSLDGTETVITTLSDLDLSAAIEGLILGAYRFTDFRSSKTAPKDAGLREITVLASQKGGVTKATNRRPSAPRRSQPRWRPRATWSTPRRVTSIPAEFAKRAKALGDAAGLEVEVLDDKVLAKEGYGGVIGVGKGSSRPPRLVRLAHRGAKSKKAKTVALVGKGITFDTGGISIKPAANMHHMTSDMGGAAAVIATVVLAAKQQLPIDVIATVPMAENMPSSTAQRPGDVLTQYGGITVEVLNTDAEGRLILADAIVRACQDEPDYLIETSTLTGAQTVALGARTPGVMGSDEFRDRVAELSQAVGENGWPMPLPEELKEDLKSTVADLANVSGSRYAGMLVAGTYLREFVADGVQWAHIDIAGPAYNTGGPWGYTGKGGTGVPTRTMFAVLEDIAASG